MNKTVISVQVKFILEGSTRKFEQKKFHPTAEVTI